MQFSAFSSVWPVLVILLVFIPVARAVFGLIARGQGYSFTEQAIERDNPAVLLRFAGLLAGTTVAFIGSIQPTNLGIAEDVKSLVMNGVAAIIAMFVSVVVNDKAILFGVNNTSAIVDDRSTSVAIVEFATCISTGLIFAAALGGPVGSFSENLIWFVVGQVCLVLLAFVFGLIVPGVRRSIESGNTSCGVALGGFLLSGALVLREAINRSADLVDVPVLVLVWLGFMIVVELALNYLIIPGARMRREMLYDNNWGIGLVHAAVSVVTTLSFITLVS